MRRIQVSFLVVVVTLTLAYLAGTAQTQSPPTECMGDPVTILGTQGNDFNLDGTSQHDSIAGWTGSDTSYAKASGDSVCGNEDGDSLFGQGGHDVMNGGSGPDALEGGTENDHVIGGAGYDYVIGGYGADTLQGDLGNDDLGGRQGNDTLRGGDDIDELADGAGQDIIDGGSGGLDSDTWFECDDEVSEVQVTDIEVRMGPNDAYCAY